MKEEDEEEEGRFIRRAVRETPLDNSTVTQNKINKERRIKEKEGRQHSGCV